jgi:hypothetical protein
VSVKNSESTSPSIARRQQSEEKRRALISEAALLVGASWARSWCETLHEEGRRVDGGWPGTRSESRSRVRRHLDKELSKRGLAPLDHAEIEQATEATYDRARSDWLSLVNSRKASRRRALAANVDES